MTCGAAISGSAVEWERVLGLIPGYDPWATAGECTFDASAADHVVGFFSECLVHVKGEWAGKPFVLVPWEQAIVGNLFGWKRPDGTRRYREALVYLPRKQGKSLMASGIALYMLFCSGEAGAEIYVGAADREQAKLIWDVAKRQVLANPILSGACSVYQNSIVIEQMGSSFKAISADANTKHGYNSLCVIVDELHAQQDRELVDVLVTSTGARREPLVVCLTTADYARESICNEKHAYATKVRDGVIGDPAFLPVVYEAKPDDDWADPAVWERVNPNLGVSLSREYLERECKRAKEQPAYQNTFRRLHLNVRTESDVVWIPIDRWDQCRADFHPDDLEGKTCYAGLDLASTTDLCALVLYFPEDGHAVLPFFWAPREGALKREKRDRVPYTQWARDGHLVLTEGDVADYEAIRLRLKELSAIFDIRQLAFDRWGATKLVNDLKGDGLDVVAFGQGYASMSAPSKELEKLVLGKVLRHDGHPVLRWNASNVMVETDAAGNIKPSKRKSTDRIDGIVALVMAVGLAAEPDPPWDPTITVL